jgi:hypothetical protein
MISCVLEGMKNNAHTQVNCDKIRAVTQGPEENPALFLAHLMDAITKYTNLDLNSPALALFLHGPVSPRYLKKAKAIRTGTQDPSTRISKCGISSVQ